MENKVEQFFDSLASSWDEGETCPIDRKLSLLKEVGIKPGDHVLDVACGTGVVTGLIHELSNSDVVGIDLSNNMIQIAKDKYKGDKWASFVHSDLLTWDTLEKFDDIIIYNAYPHFLDCKALANKAYSLLNKGGRLAILHSLSRAQLCIHHSGTASQVSRTLEEPKKEAEYFKDKFDVIKAKEDDNSIVIVLERK